MISLAIVTALVLQQPLKLDLRLGDAWTYRLEHGFVPPDSTNVAEDEERFFYEFKVRVTGAKRDEFDLETRSRLIKHRFGGEMLPGATGFQDQVEVVHLLRSGGVNPEIGIYSVPEQFRLSRLTWVGFPSAPSQSWKVDWPLAGSHWAPSASATFRRMGRTERLGRACALIDYQLRESLAQPMKATGRFEVDEKTGILMYAEVNASSAPKPGAEGTRNLNLRYEVTGLKLQAR